ncbi:DUF262 domain-containing protein [Kitasatospora sp. NPDC056327]|uniref:GmrSD restriction endonuclease domain-containing protein n=1 Tax=Kitasatospora sp. NPDC056327 TaxID=3345785 RepID=UPI0035DE2E7D
MHAQEVTFIKLVQGEKQFQVPLYQRTYSWTQPELRQLWDDVSDLVEAQLDGESPASHFLGSVVLAPGQLAAGGVQRWLVVDGQQRLTTLMLAFTALRDHLRETGGGESAKAADKIEDQYLVNKYLDGTDHYRLLPTQADRDAFIACVSGGPRAGGEGNIGAAYRFFRGVYTEGSRQHGPEWTDAVMTALGALLSIVEITADAQDNVFRIFESINNTGVGLSQSDLLRNYVFMLLPTRGERVYQQLWLPMQQQLGPKNLELLVWLDLVVRGNSRAKQTDIYREQQRRLQPLAGNEDALQAEIAALTERGQRLLRVLDPSRETDPALRAALERLGRWGGQTHYPLALFLLDRVDAGDSTAAEAAEALRFVESYLVRRLLCQSSTTGLNRLFMEAPKELEQGLPVAQAVRRYLSAKRTGARVWPDDAEVMEAVRRKPFYTAGRSQQRFFVLRTLEESYGASEVVDYARSPLTVEHVLPQNPSRAWFELLAEEAEDGQGPQEMHELLVHTLGNLSLSGENSRLSNHPFRRKQEILDSSALRMNLEIAAEPRWGAKEIAARSERLGRRAVEIWPGPIRGKREVPEEWPGWSELRSALVAVPAGSWTTYGAMAALIGSHPVPVRNYLAGTSGLHGAYRVLTADGRVSDNFRWPDGDQGDPRTLLAAEGVPFDGTGRASVAHRLSADDLATLLDKELPRDNAESVLPDAEVQGRAARFEQLLRENHPALAESVLSVLGFWQRLDPDCSLVYGRAAETSCFPTLDLRAGGGSGTSWPLAVYPVAGTVEVVFQYLRTRPPFDDTEARRELLRRLNQIDGIQLAEAKLELRPSFPIEVLARQSEEIQGALEWFVHFTALHLAQQAA